MEQRATRPKGPGMVFGALTLALMVSLAVITLTARQPPPPSIAEFAPQAVQQIKESQANQEFGAGLGSDAPPPPPAAETQTELEKAAAIEVPRVKKCVGDPPRQIEDPQSPPCVAYWDGDNGGATARGVNADTINVVVNNDTDMAPIMQDFFNRRFQFYGRKLRLIPTGANGNATCAERKGHALAVAQQSNAFLSTALNAGAEPCYVDELARLKVMVVDQNIESQESLMKERHPYLWQYGMGLDEVLQNIGRWICNRLAGQTARHTEGVGGTPPTALNEKRRVFGLIGFSVRGSTPPAIDDLEQELRKCGETTEGRRYYYPNDASGVYDASVPKNAILQMQSRGATTIICLCGGFELIALPGAATSQNYFPEWLFSSYGIMDNNPAFKAFFPDAAQRRNALGLAFQPRQVPYEMTPAIWAIKETQPNRNYNADANQVNILNRTRFYRGILALSSAIQLAGPNLTPETFASGLARTRFPNPDHPIRAGKVGFTDGDHSMTDDATEWWWSEEAVSPYSDDPPGALCYLDGGKRYALSDWQKLERDRFFEGACDSGA